MEKSASLGKKISGGLVVGSLGAIGFIIISTLVSLVLKGLREPIAENMKGFYRSQYFNPDLMFLITMYIVFIIFGIVIGFILNLLYDSIPGKNFISKGISYGIIIWLLLIVMPNIMDLLRYNLILKNILLMLLNDMIGIILSCILMAFIKTKIVK
jgi:hypothetical protein